MNLHIHSPVRRLTACAALALLTIVLNFALAENSYADDAIKNPTDWQFAPVLPEQNLGAASAGDSGQTRDSSLTGEAPGNLPTHRIANPTTTQRTQLALPPVKFAQLDKTFGGTLPKDLPQTRSPSLIQEAGGLAESIYGNSGSDQIPPFNGFTEDHRINAGINSPGLTTGHHDDSLPEAGGYPTHGKP